MELIKVISIGVLTTTMLLGCGGGGSASKTAFGDNYTGKKSPATIDESNTSDLANSSISVTRALTVGDSLSSVPIGAEIDVEGKDVIRQAAELAVGYTEGLLGNLPVAAEVRESGSCGGYFRASGNDSKYTINFYNYCDYSYDARANIILNGRMVVELSGDNTYMTLTNYSAKTGNDVVVMSGEISLTESGDTQVFSMNVTATANGVTETANFRETCNTRTGQCSLEQELTIADGTTYLVEDAEVDSFSSGWYIDAKFYDPVEGSISMSAQGIVFCEDGKSIESGSITLVDGSNNQLSLLFSSCTELTVSLNNTTANVVAQ